MGRFVVADALRAVGRSVEVHHDHFDQSATDAQWLIPVGRKGWIVLTKDRHVRSNQIEIASIINAQVASFNLVSANMTGADMAKAFLEALPDMERMVRRIARPFVANVTRTGRVHVLYRYADLAKRMR